MASEQTAEISQFGAALAQVQAALPRIRKNTDGQAGPRKYKYADLADVTAAVFPLLAKHGLSFCARPTLHPDYQFVLAYELLHHSGESRQGFYPLGTGGPQQLGSAISYARRYALCAVTGIAPDDDDDDAATAQRDDGLPVNRDGSLSRSRTTDEEKDRAGVMTSAQLAGHTALQPKRAEVSGQVQRFRPCDCDFCNHRSGGPWMIRIEERDGAHPKSDPVDDPWLDTLPPPSEIDQDTPGTITRQQQSAMHAAFAALGMGGSHAATRKKRLDVSAKLLDLPALGSSSDLSYRQAGTLLEKLEQRQREGTRA